MILSSKILTIKDRSAFVKYKPTNASFIVFRLFITVSKYLSLNHLLNVSILILYYNTHELK